MGLKPLSLTQMMKDENKSYILHLPISFGTPFSQNRLVNLNSMPLEFLCLDYLH